MPRFEGRVVVVTGGNSGIGLAAAREFAAAGARLVLFGRDHERLREAADSLPGEALVVAGDLADLADLDRLVAATIGRFGAAQVLFLNAGVAPFAPVAEVSEAVFDQGFAVNVKAKFFAVQKFLPHLGPGAAIVLTATGLMHRPLPESSVYVASNAAVLALARALAVDLAGLGIRVNVLSPGPTDTPIYDRYGMPPDETAGLKQSLAERTLLGRMADPREMARAALFLAGDESSYLTGAEIVADGGYALR